MKTQIALKAMKFYAYHGVGEQERVVGNHFEVDLLVTAPFIKAVQNDDLKDTIDYSAIHRVVAREMAVSSQLLEHVAGRIMAALKQEFPQITAIEIRLAKLNPPFGADLHSAAVIVNNSFSE